MATQYRKWSLFGGLFPTPLFRRLGRSPIQFPIILALPRRVRNGSGPKFVIFWLSRGAPFWVPLRALLRALNATIFNKFEKYSLLHKKVAQVVTSLHKIFQNSWFSFSSKVQKITRSSSTLFLQDLRTLFTQFLTPFLRGVVQRPQDGFNRVSDLRPATPSLTQVRLVVSLREYVYYSSNIISHILTYNSNCIVYYNMIFNMFIDILVLIIIDNYYQIIISIYYMIIISTYYMIISTCYMIISTCYMIISTYYLYVLYKFIILWSIVYYLYIKLQLI